MDEPGCRALFFPDVHSSFTSHTVVSYCCITVGLSTGTISTLCTARGKKGLEKTTTPINKIVTVLSILCYKIVTAIEPRTEPLYIIELQL